jgi:hypothetical protein
MYEEIKCDYCKGTTRGDTCPFSLTCPTCNAEPKQACKNPSGHKYNAGSGSNIHKEREKAAHKLDDQNGFEWRTAYGVKK